MEESIIPQMKKTMHDLLEIENSFCELTGMLVTHDLEFTIFVELIIFVYFDPTHINMYWEIFAV